MKNLIKAQSINLLFFLAFSGMDVSCRQNQPVPVKRKPAVYKAASNNSVFSNNGFLYKKVSCCKGSPSRGKMIRAKAEK